jgi:predicted Rossmann-fold nucleotide-binding protein
MFEILTLMQTRKIERPIPIILFGSAYWSEIVDFEALVRHGMIEREDLELFKVADDPVAALALLQAGIQAEWEAPTPAMAHSKAPPAAG